MAKRYEHPTKAGQCVRVIQSGGQSLGETIWNVEAIADHMCDLREHGKVGYAAQCFPRDMLAVVPEPVAIICPKCKRTSKCEPAQVGSVSCGDCLMEHTEVVHFIRAQYLVTMTDEDGVWYVDELQHQTLTSDRRQAYRFENEELAKAEAAKREASYPRLAPRGQFKTRVA